MSADAPRRAPSTLEATLSAFADRLFRTGGRDPGDEVLAIPPKRLAIYRDLLVGNYRSMLLFAFPATFRLLRAELAFTAAANGDAKQDDVVTRFLATSPSSTHSTREIADRFLGFFAPAYRDLIRRRPELPDLLTVERAELRALYHVDDPGRGATAEDVQALRAGSVDAFLATQVVRAPSAALLRVAHPVKALLDELHARRVPPSPAAVAETIVVARHPGELTPVLRVVADPGATALTVAAEGETLPLEALAERWFAAAPPGLGDLDETAAFRCFGDTVLDALADGFLRLA
jgi:hypothetical protein